MTQWSSISLWRSRSKYVEDLCAYRFIGFHNKQTKNATFLSTHMDFVSIKLVEARNGEAATRKHRRLYRRHPLHFSLIFIFISFSFESVKEENE